MADKYENLRQQSSDKEFGSGKSGRVFHPKIAKNTNRILASACDMRERDSYDFLS